MAKLVAAITKSVGPVGNITLILGVIIYIFAVAGIKVFGDAYKTENSEDVPRWNFNDFWHAFVMVFRILCGEWIEPLWDCMKATSPLAILFFLPAFVIGNFIVSIQWSAKRLFLRNLSHLDTRVKTLDVSHTMLLLNENDNSKELFRRRIFLLWLVSVTIKTNTRLHNIYTHEYASDKRGLVSILSQNHCRSRLRGRVKIWENISRSGGTPLREFCNPALKFLPLIFWRFA